MSFSFPLEVNHGTDGHANEFFVPFGGESWDGRSHNHVFRTRLRWIMGRKGTETGFHLRPVGSVHTHEFYKKRL